MDITVDGISVHAATGSRPINPKEPAVILIHGAGMNRTVWQLQTRNIAYMGRQVYALDLPGHGRSSGNPLASIEEMAEWLAKFMDAAGLASATLIGHSMGSLIALEFAARFPERMDRLCLMGVAETMPVHPDLLAAAEKNDPVAAELIVYWGLGNKAQTGGHPHPGLWMQGASQTLLDQAGPDVLFNDLSACNAYQGALAAAAKIECETRFVLGDQDNMTPARKATGLVSSIKNSDSKMIDKCGHMMMTERPNQVYAALKGIV